MTVWVGTSGWRYPGWRGDFYPAGLPQRRELEYAAARMNSIEINGSFYALQRPSSYARWHDETPDDFVFAVKGSRYITHLRRLRNVETPLANFFASGVLALGTKLGPLLWQLPEALEFDARSVERFLVLLPRTTAAAADLAMRHDARLGEGRVLTVVRTDQPIRHALEFRSPTFATSGALGLLREHGVACVLADTAGRFPQVDEPTGDFRYLRLHGNTELYASGYAARSLDEWAERIRGWSHERDVYAYFDNDTRGFAPHNAADLLDRLRRRRTPE